MRHLLASITAFALLIVGLHAEDAANPAYYDYRIINVYPHDDTAFTQGLLFDDGILIESTGQRGQSSVRKVRFESGEVLARTELPGEFFGEGVALADGKLVSLTWRGQKGFVFDKQSLSVINTFAYKGEGWGITHDGDRFIMSDGTSMLRMLDTTSLEVVDRMEVTLRGKPLAQLNELEWINGEIFANVWRTNGIVRIDPGSGAVTGVIDLRGLLPEADFTKGQTDVLNGIAYDPEADRLFVTGKNWPKLFEIELVKRGEG
ncbi:MAG: glutaminyl-peptide cyclotransferase [Pseudomonadota bacterium]